MEVDYKTKANNRWNSICKKVLSKDDEDFRGFLKSVNSNMYLSLKKMGDKYQKYMKNKNRNLSFNASQTSNRNSDEELNEKQDENSKVNFILNLNLPSLFI